MLSSVYRTLDKGIYNPIKQVQTQRKEATVFLFTISPCLLALWLILL